MQVVRTVLVTIAASLLAGLIGHVVDRLLGLDSLTAHGGGVGSLLRLLLLGLIMLPIVAGVLLAARVPEAASALAWVRRRLRPGWPARGGSRSTTHGARPTTSDGPTHVL